MNIIRDYLLEIVLAIVSFILLLLLVLPYFSGYKIQSDYSGLINSVSQNTGLSFEVVEFQRHWFRSDARLLVKDKRHQALFEFKHQIIHGPLYLGLLLEGRSPLVNMVIKGTISPDNIQQGLFSKVLLSSQPVQVKAYIGFNNDAVASILMPAINDKVAGVTYQTEKFNVDLQYYPDESRFKGEISIPALISYDQSRLELEDFILNFDEVITNDGFSGDIVLSFGLLKFISKQRVIDFRKVSARFKNAMKNNSLDMGVDINVSKINLFNEQINSLSFGLLVNKLNLTRVKEDFVFFKNSATISDDELDFSRYEYESLKIDPFNFYSEHGTFLVSMMLKTNGNNFVKNTNYFSDKDAELDVSLSLGLFKRVYEIISSNTSVSLQQFNLFARKMLKLNYMTRNLDKLKVNIFAKDDVFVINDQKVNFNDLSNNFMSNVFLN